MGWGEFASLGGVTSLTISNFILAKGALLYSLRLVKYVLYIVRNVIILLAAVNFIATLSYFALRAPNVSLLKLLPILLHYFQSVDYV